MDIFSNQQIHCQGQISDTICVHWALAEKKNLYKKYLCTNLSKEGANKPQLQGWGLKTRGLRKYPQTSCPPFPSSQKKAAALGCLWRNREQWVLVSSVPLEMWQGDHILLLQGHCIITQDSLSNRSSHRELNSKGTRQQLHPWPWFCLFS